MGTYSLPNGVDVDAAEEVAVWVWAMYFAHAQIGLGLEIEVRDARVRVVSVYAPLYGGADVAVDFDGRRVCDCSEQSPCVVSLDECRALVKGPPQWRVTWRDHARRLGAEAAARWTVEA